MQKLDEKKNEIAHQSNNDNPRPLITRKSFDLFDFFTSPGIPTRGKTGATILPGLPSSSPSPKISRVAPDAVKDWVGMEEKIIQGYKERKTLFKASVSLGETPTKQPLSGPRHADIRKGFALFGFSSSPKIGPQGGAGSALPPKSVPLAIPHADLAAVRNWVGMEEKIIHDYQAPKAVLPKAVTPRSASPAKQPSPAFETFSTQTTVSLAPRVPPLKESLRGPKKFSFAREEFFPVLGWLAAGALVFLYFQGVLPSREAAQRLQAEKNRLKQSYAELQNASENQAAEMKWLANQLRDAEADLKTARESKAEFSRSLEKKYREELMRLTVRYETELDTLRETVSTQNAVAGALKAQIQALEKILDQIRMSAVSGGVAGFFQSPSQAARVPVSAGQITSISGRQGFFVMNLGAGQGARSGRWVTVSREGIRLATGRIDRVYPSMSAVNLRDRNMLNVIQEGDTVLFSN